MKVMYLISGPSHLPYVVTSIRSLRERSQFSGLVELYAWPESAKEANELAKDSRLDVKVIERSPRSRERNSTFLEKVHLMVEFSGDGALFIDADTLPVQPLHSVSDCLQHYSMVVTQFSNWTTQKRIIQNRLNSISHLKEVEQELAACRENPIPSVNNGVLACRADSLLLLRWAELVEKVYTDVFIPDEVCLHPIVASPLFEKEGFIIGGQFGYNASPRYAHPLCMDEDVHIWHFHGDCHVRPEKSPKGHAIWFPYYVDTWRQNYGFIKDWFRVDTNKWLQRLSLGLES